MRPLLLLGICAFAALGVLGYGLLSSDGVGKTRRLNAERQELEQRVETLETENAHIAHDIEQLRDEDNTAYLEKTVREELGYIRPDEVVVLTE